MQYFLISRTLRVGKLLIEMDTEKEMDPVEKAFQWVASVIIPNQTTAEVVASYDKWSTDYDKEFNRPLNYRGHKVVVDAVEKYLSDNKDISVLDVAAGTGIVGEELKARGFTNVDGLDPSEGMLNVARQNNVYRNSYDVLTVAGGMAEGHMKCDCLPEMVRCVKTGGLIVISAREHFMLTVAEYKDRFEPLMKQLEMDGQWKILERTVVPNLYHIHNGLLFVLKVTKIDN